MEMEALPQIRKEGLRSSKRRPHLLNLRFYQNPNTRRTMKIKNIKLIAAMMISLITTVSAQTTEFVYQGHLQNSSVPANGSFDLEFVLFDTLAGPNQFGPTLTRTGVTVTGGVFSVNLDFGSNYPGAPRFLEIRARQT